MPDGEEFVAGGGCGLVLERIDCRFLFCLNVIGGVVGMRPFVSVLLLSIGRNSLINFLNFGAP